MDVIEKYSSGGNPDYILKEKNTKALIHISDDDINKYIDMLCNKICQSGVGKKLIIL